MRKIVMSTTQGIFALPAVACGVLIVGAGPPDESTSSSLAASDRPVAVDKETGDQAGAFSEQGQVSPRMESENPHPQTLHTEAVTVSAVGPGLARAGETVVFEFMITAVPAFFLRAYVITMPCALAPQEGATGTVAAALIDLDETRSDWVWCGAPCNCICPATPVVDPGDCAEDPPRHPIVGWAAIFREKSPAVGVGPAYLAEVEYTVSGDATGSFDFEFVDPETPDNEPTATSLRDSDSGSVFANWIGTTVVIVDVDCLVDGDCNDGQDCTLDTCDSENLCVNEFQAQVYADICLPYNPPDGPQPNIDDILCILDDFADGAAVDGCPCDGFRNTTDLHPCPEDGGGDGIIGIDDIIKMLDAFGGLSPCDDPCPG